MDCRNNFLQILLIIIVLIIVFWTAPYFWIFNGSLSDKNSDWGNFGDYINALTGIMNLAVLSILTYMIHKETKTMERPVLTFYYDEAARHYYCINVGKGSALNVIIVNKLKEGDDYFQKAVNCFSLPPSEKILINWLKGTAEFIVLYEDVVQNEHAGKFKDHTWKMVQDSDFKQWSIERKGGKITKLFGQEVKANLPYYSANSS